MSARSPQALVIDASALIDAIRRIEVAERIFSGYEPCAPALIEWEFAHFVFRARPGSFGDLKARRKLVTSLLAPFRLVDQRDRLDALALLCEEHNMTAYDAAYLQLALDEGAPLLTHDAGLRKAAAKTLGASRSWTLDQVEAPRDDE
jgi:predicted nucleic acid-binding protein